MTVALESDMASCCRAAPCEELFTSRLARADLALYRRRGLDGVSRRMVASLPTEAYAGGRVLDIGGGIGAFQAELLKRGARSGEVVELVGSYAPYAATLAAEAGLTDRSTYRVHDLLAEPEAVEPADVVVLNKVICCSSEGLKLVRAAADLTRCTLVLSYPRDSWLTRLAGRTQHAFFRLVGRSYRFFVRPSRAVTASAEAAGLKLVDLARGAIWERATFRRAPAAVP